jgi:hypothetical protein
VCFRRLSGLHGVNRLLPGFIASLAILERLLANSPLGLIASTHRKLPNISGTNLSLTLLVLCVFADHAHHPAAVNDLALIANLLD